MIFRRCDGSIGHGCRRMDTTNHLLILSRGSERYKRQIQKCSLPALQVDACDSPEGIGNRIRRYNIILAEPSLAGPLLNAAEGIQWLQSTFAGVDALMGPGTRSDYVLTGIKDVFGPTMSEYVFAYLVILERQLFRLYDHQKERLWKPIPYRPLGAKRMGICGVGSIGRHIALTARQFGMEVWGYKRSKESVPGVDHLFSAGELSDFLTGVDYVVITLPLTRETRHLFDENALAWMKATAILVNVGRGSIVDEKALIRCLKSSGIRGAVLDVFEKEPLRAQSALWSLPNVIITPHTSAYSFVEDIVAVFESNYRRFIAGQPLRYVVDFVKGY